MPQNNTKSVSKVRYIFGGGLTHAAHFKNGEYY